MKEEHRNPWDLVRDQLEKKLSAESFENWIARTRFFRIEEKTVVVHAPDLSTVSILEEEYSHQINVLTRGLGVGLERVTFLVEQTANGNSPPSSNVRFDPLPEIESPVTLNPRFTFRSFVVGSSNQIRCTNSFAAAIRVKHDVACQQSKQ